MTTACGAALGAYEAVKDEEETPLLDACSFDVQMDYIKYMVWHHRARISAAEEPASEVTSVLYEHTRDYFLDLLRNKYKHKGKIILLGGIQINAEPRDYFEPRMYCVIEADGSEQDLLPELIAFDQIKC